MNDTPLPSDVQAINPESHIKRMAGSHTPAGPPRFGVLA
jgi:hypothetical protein